MEITIQKMKQIMNLDLDKSILFQLKNGELKVLYYSNKVPSLYGYTEDEFSTCKYNLSMVFATKQEMERVLQLYLGIVNNDTVTEYTVKIPHKLGYDLEISCNAVYIGEYNNYPVILSKLNDLTHVKRSKFNSSSFAEQENKINKIIEFTGIKLWDVDAKTRKIIKSTNLDKNKILPDSDIQFPDCILSSGSIPKEYEADFIYHHKKVFSGIPTYSFEQVFQFPNDENYSYLLISYSAEFDENNELSILHGMSMDITEQRNAETNFKHRMHALANSVSNTLGVFQFNVTQNKIISYDIKSSNLKSFESITTIDEFVSEKLKYIPKKSDQIAILNMFSRNNLLAQFSAGKYHLETTYSMKNQDGLLDYTNSNIDLLKNPVSGDIEAICSMLNVHKEIILENMMHGIISQEFDFVLMVDIDSDRFVMSHRTISKDYILNNFTEKFKKELSSFIHWDEERERVLSLVNTNKIMSELKYLPEFVISFNTEEDPYNSLRKEMHFYRLSNNDNLFLISCRDITAQYLDELEDKKTLKIALEHAEAANKAKTDFLSLISHDIRTPLNGIMGMLQLVLRSDIDDKSRDYLMKAKTSSDFLLGLINEILDMARIESGKISFSPEMYSSSEFNYYLQSVIVPLANKNGINYKQDIFQGEEISIYVDKLRFNQIIFNVLSNAIKYTPEGGNVSLSSSIWYTDDYHTSLRFIVKDNGIGMSEEFQKHLFDVFTQENRIRSTSNTGSGLGLSIVYRLVKLMNGDITIVSEENKGTTVTIELNDIPNSKASPVSKKNKKEYNTYQFENKLVLVCEDNEINQEIIVELLKNVGIRVEVANDGAEGIKMFESKPSKYYNAILMDVRMPVLDGIEATKQIRASKKAYAKKVPIIAMTANAMQEDKDNCLEAGMTDFLTKPIDIELLYTILYKYFN